MSQNTKTLLITGSAGFIGSNLVLRLLNSQEPLSIVGLDNLNDYYDSSLKEYRLRKIQEKAEAAKMHTYKFIKGNLADKALIDRLFAENQFDIVVNLAAQAGSAIASHVHVTQEVAHAQVRTYDKAQRRASGVIVTLV